jgi:hypothetical protein
MTTEEAYAMIDAIMQLARSIRACGFTPGIDGTVISELQKLVHAQNDDPEGRGTACEARDALLTLRSAAASLIEDIEQDLDALTFNLTAGEARRALIEYEHTDPDEAR